MLGVNLKKWPFQTQKSEPQKKQQNCQNHLKGRKMLPRCQIEIFRRLFGMYVLYSTMVHGRLALSRIRSLVFFPSTFKSLQAK